MKNFKRIGFVGFLCVFILFMVISCSEDVLLDFVDPINSTIVFADGLTVTRQMGSGFYTNVVTGVGDGVTTYNCVPIGVVSIDENSGSVTLVAEGTTMITVQKEAKENYMATSKSYLLTVVLVPSTIVFADDSTVTKQMGSGSYTNIVSGVGTGEITYTSGTPATATVDENTGVVTIVALGTSVITAEKVAMGNYASSINSYSLTVLGIGSVYQGGKIAYILKAVDSGYVAGETHGLIAAIADQATTVMWYSGTFIETFATGMLVGTGNANTTAIVEKLGSGIYAAKICFDYINVDTGTGVYSDWYLPSYDELNKLYLNRVVIGGFSVDDYWSSSEHVLGYSWEEDFSDARQHYNAQNVKDRVRAVRSF